MAKRNRIKNANEKENKIKVIINYLSFKDWIKAFGLIAAFFSIFGITNLNITTIGKKTESPIGPFAEAGFGPSSSPPKSPSHKRYNLSINLDINTDDEQTKMDKLVMKGPPPGSAHIEYEIVKDKEKKRKLSSKSSEVVFVSSPPIVAMMASPPPPEIIYDSIIVKGISKSVSSNNVSIIDSDAETLLNKIQTLDGIVITYSSKETDEYLTLINSHNQIKSLWDVYCYDPDFSNQCEIFNHD